MSDESDQLEQLFNTPKDFGHLTDGQQELQAAQLHCVSIVSHPLASRTLLSGLRTDAASQPQSSSRFYGPGAQSLLRYPGYGNEDPRMRRWSLIAGHVTAANTSIDDMVTIVHAHYNHPPGDIRELRVFTHGQDSCFEFVTATGSYFLVLTAPNDGTREVREAYSKMLMVYDFPSDKFGIKVKTKMLGVKAGRSFFTALKETWATGQRIRTDPTLWRPWEQSRAQDEQARLEREAERAEWMRR